MSQRQPESAPSFSPVTDRPADPVDEQLRQHLVENHLESKAELDVVVGDYLARANQLRVVPTAAISFN